MMSNRDSLRKFFAWTLVFLYQGFVSDAYAPPSTLETEGSISIAVTDPTIRDQVRTSQFSSSTTAASTIEICPKGQYVAACGNYRIGFNWLKSAKLPNPDQSSATASETASEVVYKETRNYYVSDNIMDLYNQMRIFFGNTTTSMEYLDNDGVVQITNNFQEDREAILNNLCHPSTVEPKCKPCPNNANIAPSTVSLDGDLLTIQYSWEFHTFADCYIQEFEDTTGTYFYVPDDINFDIASLDSSTTVAQCYYTNTDAAAMDALMGDAIGIFVTGIYRNRINANERVEIPKGTITMY